MKLLPLFILFCFPLALYGQELPVYNEYHLNKALINPAIIGSEECTLFKGTDRHQWIGIEGAPSIQTVSVEAGIFNKKALRDVDKKIHGLGAFLYRDKNGAYRNLGAQASYSYHFFLNKKYGVKMGLGLSFRYSMKSVNESDFTKEFDPIVSWGVTNNYYPDAGTGIFVYNSRFYAGFSAAQLLKNSRNYFLMAGYLTGADKDRVRFLPSLVLKATEDLRKQIDLNGKLLMDDSWWLSLSYRHNFDLLPGLPTSIIPMIGVVKGNFTFGYAIDITPGTIQRFNYGTHEFMLSYKLCRDGFRCPVYR